MEFLRSFLRSVGNKNHQKAILNGLPILLGEEVAANTQATVLVADIASYVRDIYSFEHCTLLEDFRNQKNEYHF